jgi:hypothetical protein
MIRPGLAIFTAVIVVLGSSGCSRRTPVATVVLVDPSASVTERARKDEFAAIATLIPRMQRGDLLTIIPITDNAAADIEGRVPRFHAPDRREAYDADLRQFQANAGRQYAEFAANLLAHPGQRTDILGALDVAMQEFEIIPAADRRRLVVLSDFLEDDDAYKFVSDRRLSNSTAAQSLAQRVRNARKFRLARASLYLGELSSTDFASLTASHQAAVRTFWSQYLTNGLQETAFRLDGVGLLALSDN